MSAVLHDLNEARSALAYALRYALLGWHVLPLDPGTKKPLGRLARNGFHDATTDDQLIRAWWASEPTAGIGVAMKASGLVAVDIDPRNGGLETMERLEAMHGPIVSDVLAYTGGGGEHRVFAASLVEHLPGKLGPGVDLMADGYIAVEPTFAPLAEPPHRKPYAWESSSDPLDGIVPSTLPAWIRDMSRHAPALPAAGVAVPPIRPQRHADAQDALQHIQADERDTWVQVGQAINNEMPGADGFALWDAWSQQSPKYDPRDQLRVWRSFKPRGLAGVGLNTVFKMAQDSGWKNSVPAVDAQQHPATAQRKGVPMLRLVELEALASTAAWAIKHILPSNSVGMMFGAPGTFKSFIALDMALHMAHGLLWMGRKTEKAPVIYLAAEGGTGLWRRIKAWHLYRGLSWADVPLYVVPVAVSMRSNAGAIVDAARELGVHPGLVVVDTLSQTFEGEENSANDMASYLTALGTAFRELWQCAVMVIHHSGHGATERPRGSSAILGNTDFLFGVFRDEKQLLATVTCERQKDGELFKDELFELTSELLGKDSDGDEIRSLTAHHVNPGSEAAEALVRQASVGRGGRTQQLLDLAHNGMLYASLRHAFYDALGETMKPEAKQKAFVRAWCEAKDTGFLEAKEGRVLVFEPVDKSSGAAP